MTSRVARTAKRLAVLMAFASTASAQTVLQLDGSLPNGRTDDLVVTQAGPVYTIDESMGEARGRNLFHSFLDFSVAQGDTASFVSGQPFERVLVRVTGGRSSTINGTLRSTVLDGGGNGADLFVLNPAGVLFGAGAQLDVMGRLFLSTADVLNFDDDVAFDLTGDEGPPTLSVGTPESFGFLGDGPAAPIEFVANTSSFLNLAVPQGKGIVAVGGEVRAAGPVGFLVIDAPGGRVGLVGVGDAAAEVGVEDLAITTTEPDQLGAVAIEPGAQISGQDFVNPFGDQGELVIRAGRISIEGSALTFGGNGRPGVPSIELFAEDAIEIDEGGQVGALALGALPGGSVVLEADTIAIEGALSGLVSGNGGDIELIGRAVSLADGTSVRAVSDPFGPDPNAPTGSIRVRADALDVTGGAQITTRGTATSVAGDVVLDVVALNVSGSGSEVSIVQEAASGTPGAIALGAGVGLGSVVVADDAVVSSQTRGGVDGGDVAIRTGRLEIRNGAGIEAATLSGGDAGSISVDADLVVLEQTLPGAGGGFLASAVDTLASGLGGDVEIRVGSLTVANGSQISTATSVGNAGSIRIVAEDAVTLVGTGDLGNPSGLVAEARSGATGASGAIEVEADTIRIQDGATIANRARGVGDTGGIRLDAETLIEITGTGPVAGSLVEGRVNGGTGGDVVVEAPRVRLAAGGAIDATTEGVGAGGLVRIAAEDLTVEGASSQASQITANATATGDAQGIEIDLSGSLLIRDGGLLSARSTGAGNAGDVVVDAAAMRIESGGAIRTSATTTADAGSIVLTATDTIDIADALTPGEVGSLATEGTLSTRAARALGGRISLTAGQRIRLDRSSATSEVGTSQPGQSVGNGGDIEIAAPLVVLRDAGVVSRADVGNGGDIRIDSNAFVDSTESVLDASSTLGVAGQVTTTAPEADLAGQLSRLRTRFPSASDAIGRECERRTTRAGSLILDLSPPLEPAADDASEEDWEGRCGAP